MKLNYFTEKESKMPKNGLFLQGVLGLKTCKTKKDAMNIFSDIWKIAQKRKK